MLNEKNVSELSKNSVNILSDGQILSECQSALNNKSILKETAHPWGDPRVRGSQTPGSAARLPAARRRRWAQTPAGCEGLQKWSRSLCSDGGAPVIMCL